MYFKLSLSLNYCNVFEVIIEYELMYLELHSQKATITQ
jgi:hypothetical protein